MERCDVIIIGAGLNGLVSAAYLARAGKSVMVLKNVGSRGAIGGAGGQDDLTQDYSTGWQGADGFMFPTPASRLQNFPRRIVHDLDLEKHGLRITSHKSTALISSAHGILVRDTDPGDMAARLRELWPADADAYTDYIALIARQKHLLDAFIDLNAGALPKPRDMRRLAARAGQDALLEAVQLYGLSIKQVLDQRFSSPALKTLLFASTLGGYFGAMGLGPMAPTSATGLVMDPVSRGDDKGGSTCGPIEGGGAALLQSVENAAADFGVIFLDSAQIDRITHEKGAVNGVALADGKVLEAPCIIGDVDAKILLLSLFSWKDLPRDQVLSIASSRNQALVAQVNFVLEGCPDIKGLPERFLEENGSLFLLDDMVEAEKAFDAWSLLAIPHTPPLEFEFHAADTLSAVQRHARCHATAFVYYIPGKPGIGEWTEEGRVRLIGQVVNRLNKVSPGFDKRMIDARAVLPVDYEQRYGLVGGHLNASNVSLDQTLFNRPNPQMAAGRMPFKGLYLAGPGMPQAPFIDGAGGRDLARKILEQSGSGAAGLVQKARALITQAGLAP